MASVGERIRQERESRNTTLDDMALATGIGQSYLESLERGEYHELPGPAFGKLYIRAYAEVLGFDPQPWIEDYDREHRLLRGSADYAAPARTGARPMAEAIARWRESKTTAGTGEPAAEDEPKEAVEEPQVEVATPETIAEDATPKPPAAIDPVRLRETSRRFTAPFTVLGLAIAAVLIYFAMRQSGGEPHKPAIVAPPPPAAIAPASTPVKPPPPPAAPAPVAPVAKAPTPSANLTVTEFGVGRRIVNLELEGESDRFTEGDRVSFASRVLGGRRGNVIRHVWIYEGRAQQTITLRLGASDYRTHTNKTVGKAGAWAVEARDDKGRVLARTDFTVMPRSR